jgi:crotonobetainyl-CoA:carnitine CoA-transferase CaiB-like acyl-CoA transferase
VIWGPRSSKIEPPNGDESRSWPPILENGSERLFFGPEPEQTIYCPEPERRRARKIVLKLVADSDVVVENFTPGVAAKLGIDYETLKKANPDNYLLRHFRFWPGRALSYKKAYDPIVQGMTGLMSITGDRNGSPAKIGIPITDLTAASHAVTAILAAYISRLETGKGQYIDISLYDGVISWLTIMAMDYFATGKSPERWGLDHIHRVPARAFMASDGRWVQVAATSDPMYSKFCRFWA